MSNNEKGSFSSRSLALLVRSEEIIVFVTITFVALAIFIQVMLRYFTPLSLFGIEELVLIFIAWFYLISVSYAIHRGTYIRVELVSIILTNRLARRLINLVSLIVGILAIGVICFMATKYVVWAAGAHQVTTAFMISVNYHMTSLVVGSSLAVLHMSLQLTRAVGEILHSRSDFERNMGEKS